MATLGSNILADERDLKVLGIDLGQLQIDLTLPNPEYETTMRFRKGAFYKKVPKTICYLKKIDGKYLVPRYYNGEPTVSPALTEGRVFGRAINSKHNILLRDYQSKFLDTYCAEVSSSSGILLEASCGSGKTILGIWLAYLKGVQTLVIVPTYYLAKQWAQRLSEVSNASYIIMDSKTKDVPVDKDFTIVVTDLFTCRVLPDELVNNIGTVIMDEAHRMGAETYLPILDEIPAINRIALTATFRRADNVDKVLQYHFGRHLKMESRFPRPDVYALKTGVTVETLFSIKKVPDEFLDYLDLKRIKYHKTFSAVAVNYDMTLLKSKIEEDYRLYQIESVAYRKIMACMKGCGDIAYTTLDSYLNENASRRKLVIQLVQQCLDNGRTVLFLSKRKDTLKAMAEYFQRYKPMLIVSETNKRTEEEEAYLQNECRLILGVTQLAKEGLDLDRLDTLIIHLPMKDTEQAIGRISRLHPNKQKPACFYLLDNCPICYGVYNNAKKFIKINAEFKSEIRMHQLTQLLRDLRNKK